MSFDRALTAHFEDESQEWFRDVLNNHREEAGKLAFALLDRTERDGNGCLVTDTAGPAKVRYRGRQLEAYRFIHCVLGDHVASRDDVVRHRCHNRRCINPDHLVLGTQADNKRDDWEHAANGVDWDLL